MGKVHGKIVGSEHGLTVTVALKPPKTEKGKERLWLQIRQNGNKKWRVYECLSYARSVDIAFVSDPE